LIKLQPETIGTFVSDMQNCQ